MDEQLSFSRIQEYLTSLIPNRPPELLGMEEYAQKTDFQIIGPVVGHLCYLLARMVQAHHIFELGSGYGYSTAWFAKAVIENGGGTVHHVVWDEALSHRAQHHLANLGYSSVVKYHVGEAVSVLKNSPDQYDLIFNDIEKEAYPDSLPIIYENLRHGGVLVVDNLLWYGRIFDSTDNSETTKGVKLFTKLISNDPSWISSILPIRDGVLVAYKK